ncbi:MAG: hypothetical protein AAFU41_04535 [Pseudomonadota bacterium]
MRNISLRLPYLIYLSIGCIFLGVLLSPIFRGAPPDPIAEEMREHAMMHGTLEVGADGAPEVSISIAQDPMDGWNLTVETQNFAFTPETVNNENVPNTGHAHLYINGAKVARLYGPHFHLPTLPEGEHEIMVNLSSNDHSYYQVNGARIEARATITQGAGSS